MRSMTGSEYAERRHGPGDDVEARADRRLAGAAPAAAVAGSAAFVLGLQATAGNAAVAGLLRSHRTPTAPVLPFASRRPVPVAARSAQPLVVARREGEAPADEEATGSAEQVITGVEGGPGADGEAGAADASSEAGGEAGGGSADAGSLGEPGLVEGAAGEGEAAGWAEGAGPGPEEA